VLAAPYDKTLPPLLDGSATDATANNAAPAQATKLFNPAFLAALKANPNHPLRAALRDNDLIHWTPRAAMTLYHCSGDMDVLPANSQVALDSFHARGAKQVQLTDPSPGSDHVDCILAASFFAKLWFDTMVR
jgi:hypothetical protein